MAKTKKPTVRVSKPKKYWLEISVNDDVYKAKTNDFQASLKDFIKKHEGGVKTRVVIRYGTGDTTQTRIWSVPRARRLFNMLAVKDYSSEVLAQQLEQRLGE